MRSDLVGDGERVGSVEGGGCSSGGDAWFLYRRQVRRSRVAAVAAGAEVGVGFHLGTAALCADLGNGREFPSFLEGFPSIFS
jgi:hypothetical protein